jgi:hypothetical protein
MRRAMRQLRSVWETSRTCRRGFGTADGTVTQAAHRLGDMQCDSLRTVDLIRRQLEHRDVGAGAPLGGGTSVDVESAIRWPEHGELIGALAQVVSWNRDVAAGAELEGGPAHVVPGAIGWSIDRDVSCARSGVVTGDGDVTSRAPLFSHGGAVLIDVPGAIGWSIDRDLSGAVAHVVTGDRNVSGGSELDWL